MHRPAPPARPTRYPRLTRCHRPTSRHRSTSSPGPGRRRGRTASSTASLSPLGCSMVLRSSGRRPSPDGRSGIPRRGPSDTGGARSPHSAGSGPGAVRTSCRSKSIPTPGRSWFSAPEGMMPCRRGGLTTTATTDGGDRRARRWRRSTAPWPMQRSPGHVRLCFRHRLSHRWFTSSIGQKVGPPRSARVYRASTLRRAHPPLRPASILGSSWVHHLEFSLCIEAEGSHVPHESLRCAHAVFMTGAGRSPRPVESRPADRTNKARFLRVGECPGLAEPGPWQLR